jgi:Mn-containing catalase
MTTVTVTDRQVDALNDFVREHVHRGVVRASVSPSNSAGYVILAEFIGDGGEIVADRLLHSFASYTP